jgi:colanic acid biosynthesis glycosyl transferase WcaI
LKILLYGLHFAPELVGIEKVSGEMPLWLANRGHDVRVVATAPFCPAWQTMPGYRAGRWVREEQDGIEILRCPIWMPSCVSAARRLLSSASFAVTSFFPMLVRGLFWKPDVVWLSVPSLQNVPAALAAAWLGHAVFLLHVQDF